MPKPLQPKVTPAPNPILQTRLLATATGEYVEVAVGISVILGEGLPSPAMDVADTHAYIRNH